MDKTKVLSIDHFFIQNRERMFQKYAVLHSSFHQVTNYLYEDEFITIASEKIDNAPCTIRISSEDFTRLFKKPPEKLFFQQNGFLCSSKDCVVWSDAEVWREELLVYPQKTDRLRYNIQFIKNELNDKKIPRWVFPSSNQGQVKDNIEKELENLLYTETELLIKYIKRKCIEGRAAYHEIRLFGLGKGLTPSGDDIMTGIIYVISMINFPIDLQREKVKWREEAKNKTNMISYAAISHASKGYGREAMNRFTSALLYSNDTQYLLEQLAQMLTIGSSSGSEIVWGIVRGLEATL